MILKSVHLCPGIDRADSSEDELEENSVDEGEEEEEKGKNDF